jgi:hypothetical protein
MITSPDLQPGLSRRTSGRDGGNERARVFFHAQRLGDVVGHGLDLDAEPAAARLAELLQLIDDHRHRVGGHREADADRAAGRRDDRRVHADDLAVHVEQRAARVALVDGRVGLQIVVVGA